MGVASHEQFTTGTSGDNIKNNFFNKLRLFKNNFTPTVTSGFFDFTEADFSGYSSNNVAANGFSDASLNRHKITSTTEVFQHDGGGISNTVYGWYMTGSRGLTVNDNPSMSFDVLMFEKFSSPIQMNVIDDRIEVTLDFIVEMLP